MVNGNNPSEPPIATRRKAKRMGALLMVVILAFVILGTLWGIGYFGMRSNDTSQTLMPTAEQRASIDEQLPASEQGAETATPGSNMLSPQPSSTAR